MKVTFNGSSNPYERLSSNIQKTSSDTPSTQESSRNFDELTIKSDPEKIAEKKFSDSVSSVLSSEIRKPTDESKIEALKNQVADGSYQVDPDQIAGKILLTGEDSENA